MSRSGYFNRSTPQPKPVKRPHPAFFAGAGALVLAIALGVYCWKQEVNDIYTFRSVFNDADSQPYYYAAALIVALVCGLSWWVTPQAVTFYRKEGDRFVTWLIVTSMAGVFILLLWQGVSEFLRSR